MEQFFIQDGWRNNDPPIERRQEGGLVNQDQLTSSPRLKPGDSGLNTTRSLRLTFLAGLAGGEEPYSLQGYAIQPTWRSLKNLQA